MQFIKTLFVALIPLFISIYLNRKYQLADKDRTIVEKQFEIYNLLYLNIARDTLNQPINGNLAKTIIIKLIKEIREMAQMELEELEPKIQNCMNIYYSVIQMEYPTAPLATFNFKLSRI